MLDKKAKLFGNPILAGLSLTILGAIMQGGFVFPMKLSAGWRWENLWIVYSVVGLLIIPVFVAGISVPNLISVYRLSSAESIIAAALLGCAWGLANVLFGFSMCIGVLLALGGVFIIGATGRRKETLRLVQKLRSPQQRR